MEFPYSDQAKAKAQISVDDFIMFADGVDSVLDSGTVIERDGDRIVVLFENEDRDDDIIEFDLSRLTIYRDKDWEDYKSIDSSLTDKLCDALKRRELIDHYVPVKEDYLKG